MTKVTCGANSINRTKATCAMEHGCTAEVTKIDDKGFVYCSAHGSMRQFYRRVRKLTPAERERLTDAEFALVVRETERKK
jgi:hypothetical protein